MKFNLPTRERCQEIVQKTEAFYCTQRNIYGYNVELYDYRLASFGDFVNNEAWELRGLCYIQDEDGNWHRNILMNKFFNLNESKMEYVRLFSKDTDELVYDGIDTAKADNIYKQERYIKSSWMLEDIKDKKITRIQDKRDGSVISFVKFPNGVVKAKSKMSFESEQALAADAFYCSDKQSSYTGIAKLVDYCLDKGLVPIFEYTSPFNQIVLNYNDSELRVIQIRENETGRYLTSVEMDFLLSQTTVKKADDYSIDLLKNVANNYTEDELINKIGDMKFNSFDEFILYLL